MRLTVTDISRSPAFYDCCPVGRAGRAAQRRQDLGRAVILEFRDPDGITLELYAAAG